MEDYTDEELREELRDRFDVLNPIPAPALNKEGMNMATGSRPQLTAADISVLADRVVNALKPHVEELVRREAHAIRDSVWETFNQLLAEGAEQLIRQQLERELDIVVEYDIRRKEK